MQRLLDKWGLWAAFVIIGSIIAYSAVSAILREEEKPTGKNAAAQAAHGGVTPK